MSDVLATVVVEFGDGADSSALVVVELDDAVNLDEDGNARTRFVPGDRPGFIVHYDDSALRLGSVSCSSGQVTGGSHVSRTRMTQVQFSAGEASTDLPHIPAGGVSVSWYGNSPAIAVDRRKITAAGVLPAIGEASYQIACQAYQLIPPPLDLDEDETWPVLVVVRMEAAT